MWLSKGVAKHFQFGFVVVERINIGDYELSMVSSVCVRVCLLYYKKKGKKFYRLKEVFLSENMWNM